MTPEEPETSLDIAYRAGIRSALEGQSLPALIVGCDDPPLADLIKMLGWFDAKLASLPPEEAQ